MSERQGKRTGDVDWSYDFRQHFDNYATSDERREAICDQSVARLREIQCALDAGREVWATTDGGWPRIGWARVLSVGMYDGWPYWRPVPSVMREEPVLGGIQWDSFRQITGVEIREIAPCAEGAQR